MAGQVLDLKMLQMSGMRGFLSFFVSLISLGWEQGFTVWVVVREVHGWA